MQRRMRRLGLVAATALAASATAACMPTPGVCTTVGYSSILTVTLAEPRGDVALELCLVDGCTPWPVDVMPSDEPIEPCGDDCWTQAPASGDGPDVAADGQWFLEGGDAVDGWTISVLSGGDVVAYRLLDAAGTVLADGEVQPDWVRVGGTEQCGGPTEAEVVLG